MIANEETLYNKSMPKAQTLSNICTVQPTSMNKAIPLSQP